MKKLKFIRTVALLLLFATLFALLAGCATPANPTSPTQTEPTGTEPTVAASITKCVARTFVQHIGVNNVFGLDIEVRDEKVYINDILYDKVSYVENPGLTLHPVEQYWCAEGEEKTISVFEQMENCEKCYLLETEVLTGWGRKIVVYDIDGVYYFSSIVEGMGYWIHYYEPKTGG